MVAVIRWRCEVTMADKVLSDYSFAVTGSVLGKLHSKCNVLHITGCLHFKVIVAILLSA